MYNDQNDPHSIDLPTCRHCGCPVRKEDKSIKDDGINEAHEKCADEDSLRQELADDLNSEEYRLGDDISSAEFFIKTGEGGGEYEWWAKEPGQEKTARQIAIDDVGRMKKNLEQLKAAA